MPNGGGDYYPGVDPDGKTPGGLEVAGRVDAAALSLLGTDILPSVIGWGAWAQNAGVVVTQNAGVKLPLDTEIQALSGVSLAIGENHVTVTNGGIYLAFGEAYANANVISGFVETNILSDTSVNDEGVIFPIAQSAVCSAIGVVVRVLTLPDNALVNLWANNQTDADVAIAGDFALIRLT